MKEMKKHTEALLTAFEGDGFDAKKLDLGPGGPGKKQREPMDLNGAVFVSAAADLESRAARQTGCQNGSRRFLNGAWLRRATTTSNTVSSSTIRSRTRARHRSKTTFASNSAPSFSSLATFGIRELPSTPEF